jgi:CHAT domain-containing protein
MSLWKIDDKATSEFMSLFYEKLVKGHSKHEAYTYATHTMKEKNQDANHWASIVLLD